MTRQFFEVSDVRGLAQAAIATLFTGPFVVGLLAEPVSAMIVMSSRADTVDLITPAPSVSGRFEALELPRRLRGRRGYESYQLFRGFLLLAGSDNASRK